MPTNRDINRATSLFFFAHQDDEFGIFHQIDARLDAGENVLCIYATDGSATAAPKVRDQESLAVLQRMGVRSSNVFFAGRRLGIRDGDLHSQWAVFAHWLVGFLDTYSEITSCYVPAWEGGHPDHDVLHAIVVNVMSSHGLESAMKQFPLYNANGLPAPFFRVMSPLPDNGAVEQHAILWRDRVRYISYCLAYPSQWKTWIGIFPSAFIRYFVGGTQQLQSVNPARLHQPPHDGQLYYESRGFLSWTEMNATVNAIGIDQLVCTPLTPHSPH